MNSPKKNLALGLVAGLGIGLAIGLAVGPQACCHRDEDAKVATKSAPAPTMVAAVAPSTPAPAPASVALENVIRSEACKPWIAANQRLNRELAAVQKSAKDGQAVRESEGTAPLAFPETVDAVYREADVTKNYLAALRAAGVKDDVVVDCAEYPCMIFGRLESEAQLQAALARPELAAYRDGGLSSGVGTTPDGGHQFFLATYRRSDHEAVHNRVQVRFNLMYQDLYEAK